MGWKHIFCVFFCVFLCSNSFAILSAAANLETYIVHLELPESSNTQLSTSSNGLNPNGDLESWYQSFLPSTISTSSNVEEASRIVYPYHNVFKGFSARLSPEDIKAMAKKPGFVSAKPQKMFSLHTTHTPSFLGLHQNMGLWNQSKYGEGVIIGVLDTGIAPDHPSFGDEGMPPPPAKWKGKCEFNTSVCNNKLIGARFFSIGNGSPSDENGHGTHTASTAAGNFVAGANVFGNANGTAVGVAPRAHLAIYKVCSTGCSESDILAAMDVAIDDGVDILSLSLGGNSEPFYGDNIALGAYSAMEKGIFVSCSAGNDGPFSGSLSNEAPWILTVGASTTDRKIRSTAVLGNKQEFDGESLYQSKNDSSQLYPLIYLGMNQSDFNSGYCGSIAVAKFAVRGKIVVCDSGGGYTATEKGQNVKAAGGVGLIIINSQRLNNTILIDPNVLPAIHLNYLDGLKVVDYINSTKSPVGRIKFQGTTIGDNHAPEVAYFSSRGPSRASPGILKPDIIGPGVNILAAWPESVENNTNTKSTFNIISGTSMSCPHLSGVAALLKSVHPDWSPAAIKSAMMTTTDLLNLGNSPIEDQRQLPANIFATGSGHVNPSRANNPGLIYDIEPKDYIPYLCGLNYTNREVGFLLQRKVNCSVESSIPEAQLNYPSFSISFKANSSGVQRYTRTVTNVGEANSVYRVEISAPEGVNVTVTPNTLSFTQLNQKLTYEVAFSSLSTPINLQVTSQGSLTWKSPMFSVRSPIAAIIGGG
ncbi:OLC1v1031612C1 [Oldenlandia corymbosa var. corymbosa]|uniref:OLC1v1031612C1 n=1 Tax=Oldenlandia corymbosa var. corymbosa TaxID=529605 RepID=A0AAV1CLS0_OLDCO|nr:OLC1v1031612C1 [Oldenlandia corymbosa var. corymbosa]